METFPRNSPDEFPPQRPVTQSFDVFFDLRLNKRVNNLEAGDLRRHHGHYDVILIESLVFNLHTPSSRCAISDIVQHVYRTAYRVVMR